MLSQDSDQDNSFIGREISQNSNEFQNEGESTRIKSKIIFYFSNFTQDLGLQDILVEWKKVMLMTDKINFV